MDPQVITLSLLSSTVAVAIITSIKELIIWRLNRKAKVADDNEEKVDKQAELEEHYMQLKESIKSIKEITESTERKIDACRKSDKVLLQDKIKEIVLKCLEVGEVSYEDRKFVHEMWDIYHYGCDGNGDLNSIMSMFDELPIKS